MTSASSVTATRPARRAGRSIATALTTLAMAVASTAGADWDAARQAFEEGRYDDAVAELEPLAALHPDHPGTQAFLGVARIHAGDAAGAIVPLARSVSDRDHPEYHLFLAWALILDGHLDRAFDHLGAINDDLPARLVRARDRLVAIAALRLSDSVRATRLLEAAVDRGSGAPDPWIALGILAVRRGDHSEAAEAFERAVELDSSNGDVKQAALVARLRARPRSSGEPDIALRRTVERVELQLGGGRSTEPQHRGGAALWSPPTGDEEQDCTMPEDHRCIPGRLARDIADGGLSRSAAPPD